MLALLALVPLGHATVCFLKYYDGDVEFGHLLLKAEVAVARNENVEVPFGFSQQGAVRSTTPAHLLHRDAVMINESAAKPRVEAFVNQDPHL